MAASRSRSLLLPYLVQSEHLISGCQGSRLALTASTHVFCDVNPTLGGLLPNQCIKDQHLSGSKTDNYVTKLLLNIGCSATAYLIFITITRKVLRGAEFSA